MDFPALANAANNIQIKFLLFDMFINYSDLVNHIILLCFVM